MLDIVSRIVHRLVEEPGYVDIRQYNAGQNTTVIEIGVHPDERGKIIGREGRIIDALRTLASAIGGKENIRYVLNILEGTDEEEEDEELETEA